MTTDHADDQSREDSLGVSVLNFDSSMFPGSLDDLSFEYVQDQRFWRATYRTITVEGNVLDDVLCAVCKQARKIER